MEISLTAQTIRTILATFVASIVIVTSAVNAASQTTVEPAKPPGSTVRGVVTYADTGRPVRHAGVVLINNEVPNIQGNVNTDGRGEFVLRGVAAGRYVVFLDAPGILKPELFPRTRNPVIAQLRLNDKRDLFAEVVVNGSDSVSVKVQAVRGGVITGRVVTEDDQPLVNADIKLLKNENGKWLPVDFTWKSYLDRTGLQTDANGVYRLAGLPSGDYLVRASEAFVVTDRSPGGDDPYHDGSLMVTFYPSANSIHDAQAVPVIEGSEVTGIDIRMPERRAHTISGKVSGPDNLPGDLAGIWIERIDEVGFPIDTYTPHSFADREGNWRVQGIPAGEYLITVGGSIRVKAGESFAQRIVASKKITIKVANEDVIVPDIQLTTGAQVTGTVTLDGKPPRRPHELFPLLIPVDERLVRKRPPRVPTASGRRYAGAADWVQGDGSFALRSVQSGKYWVQMSTTPQTQFYLKAVTRKGVDLLETPIKLMDDTLFDDVVVTLATDFASIEGEVIRSGASAQQSLGDVVVVLAPATDATRRIAGDLLMLQADAHRKFSFTCAPGEYFLVALTPAQLKKTAPLTDAYFKNDNQKFTRVKVRAAEKLKGLTVSLSEN